MIRVVNLPQLEVKFRSRVWFQTSGNFLTVTSPTLYLFMQISGGKMRQVVALVFMFGSSGYKKIAGSLNSNWAEKLYL